MRSVKSARNVAITRGSANLFKSPWYLNSQSTNSRRDSDTNINLQMEGKSISFSTDTGAEVTVIPETVYKRIGTPHLQPSDKHLKGPTGNNILKTTGCFTTSLQTQAGTTTKQKVYVVKELNKPLLGRQAIDNLQLIQQIQAVMPTQNPTKAFPNLKTLSRMHFTHLTGSQSPRLIKLLKKN